MVCIFLYMVEVLASIILLDVSTELTAKGYRYKGDQYIRVLIVCELVEPGINQVLDPFKPGIHSFLQLCDYLTVSYHNFFKPSKLLCLVNGTLLRQAASRVTFPDWNNFVVSESMAGAKSKDSYHPPFYVWIVQ